MPNDPEYLKMLEWLDELSEAERAEIYKSGNEAAEKMKEQK